jgi:sigma54-dependent transcription regulator
MTGEEILKREDGTRVKIHVRFDEIYMRKSNWQVSVSVCQPRKRIFKRVEVTRYIRDVSNREQLSERNRALVLKVVTEEEIMSAVNALHTRMKPTNWDIF